MAGNRRDQVFVSSSPSEKRLEDGTCTTRQACNQKGSEMGFTRFSTGNFPTKGCFSKNDRVYWSDGSDDEISRPDLPGAQRRIRCDKIVEDGGGGTCTTRQACNQKRSEMGFTRFSAGNFPIKGCFSKNDRAYWSDGSDDEISRQDLPGVLKRIRCDKIVEDGGGGLRVLPVG